MGPEIVYNWQKKSYDVVSFKVKYLGKFDDFIEEKWEKMVYSVQYHCTSKMQEELQKVPTQITKITRYAFSQR